MEDTEEAVATEEEVMAADMVEDTEAVMEVINYKSIILK